MKILHFFPILLVALSSPGYPQDVTVEDWNAMTDTVNQLNRKTDLHSQEIKRINDLLEDRTVGPISSRNGPRGRSNGITLHITTGGKANRAARSRRSPTTSLHIDTSTELYQKLFSHMDENNEKVLKTVNNGNEALTSRIAELDTKVTDDVGKLRTEMDGKFKELDQKIDKRFDSVIELLEQRLSPGTTPGT